MRSPVLSAILAGTVTPGDWQAHRSVPVPVDPFRSFVEQHQRRLYALAHRLTGDHADADDLIQETFVRAWSALPALTDETRAWAWLRRILVRQFLNTRRGSLRSRFVRWSEGVLDRPGPDPTPPDATFEGALQRALTRLTERERAVFVLRHLEDRSTAETAEALDVAEGTVKALLARAVAKMQRDLQPYA
jgi:RNA polymerase sigma-70 factor, ECF subfamily